MQWITQFNRAHGQTLGPAKFRAQSEDFVVHELLGFTPSGEGEHHYLHIQKRDTNTQWLLKQLAKFAGVKPLDVGICGQKDRHAITRQWFSVYLPKHPSLDWAPFFDQYAQEFRLLEATKHNKKLRKGTHAGNYFEITLRDFVPLSEQALSDRLACVAKQGVPNYFGEQRFGVGFQNLNKANAWLVDNQRPSRHEKNFVLSAARSYLFNLVLHARVKQNTWSQLLEGECVLDGGPSGPLWGRGRLATKAQALHIEQEALEPVTPWMNGLEHSGLSQERRALELVPKDLQWHYDVAGKTLALKFVLPSGAFATAVLQEVASLDNCAAPIVQPAPDKGRE